MSGISLIVGLGNPGAQYERTRHNVGAWFVHQLAKQTHLELRTESKFYGKHGVATISGHDCQLFIPTTFMNHSGQAVEAVMSYYRIAPDHILIAHDDLDLPVGEVRLKFDGGHGGHNGLRDVIRHLNTKQFYRLRIGIGHPGNAKDVVNYVLKLPSQAEHEEMNIAIHEALSIVPLILNGEFQKAMQTLHTSK